MQTAPLPTMAEGGSSRGHAALGSRIGQYEIIRLLGRGGMGEVYLARDLRLGRLVAVKLLITQRPDLDDRFLAEARATARCRHENIVVIYEVGAYGGQPYMVLEYLEGQTLRQWMNDHPATAEPPARVPPVRAVELMLPVVRALAYAHEQSIVHRDLKPENVMLTRAGVIKVLDFGVAKHLEAAPVPDPGSAGGDDAGPTASSSALAGTRPYMSPEQLSLGAIDHRADVWAVGIMLFELVAGAHPVLDAPAPQDAQAAIADERAPMPSASERVAGLGPLAAVIDRCLIKDAAHRTPSARVLLAELEALAPDRRPVPVGHDGSPFAGLAAFQEADAGRFFGRDRDIDQVVAELRSRPLVAVVGPSGAGKSSLIRAGVIPALKRSGEGWDAHIVRPGREPLAALATVLAHADSSSGNGGSSAAPGDGADRAALEQLRAEPGILGARLRARATSKRRRTAVFVDQLEELYTLGAPPDERAAFLACLAGIADDASSPLRVLVSMRSDFLDRLAEDRRLGTEVTRGLVLLSPMDRDSMRETLVRPVEAREHRFEPAGLVDRMVDAVAATRGALPLLQFTAARLWERRDRDRRLLTEASYEELGGVAGALATHADAVLAGMSAAQRELARAVLERLVTPERTRALVSVVELHALDRDPAVVDELVQHLAAMRLVMIERGTGGADPTVELVHESLIDRWPALVRWLDDNQEDAAMLARLRAAARDWERGGHAAGLLWTGEVAREAGAWRLRYRRELAPVEQRYLAAVLAAADRARGLRRQLFGGILTAAVLVAAAMTWLAWKQTEASRTASQEAMRARDATRMAAVRTVPEDPTTQLALLREIEDVGTPPPGAAQEAKRLLSADIAAAVLDIDAWALTAVFSPDGRRIAYAIGDDAVQVLRVDGGGEPLVLHAPQAVAATYSPDGRRIACASDDRTMQVMNADGTGVALVLRGHDGEVTAAAFSPDGRRIASASKDGTARVWNADGSGEPIVLRGHQNYVYTALFSPDGQRVVSASKDRTVRVWSAGGTGESIVLRGHEDMVNTAEFSPDGQTIVSASDDRTVRVWRADGRGEPLVLRGHDGPVQSAQFSPDGRRIASGSYDGTVRLWNADGRGRPTVLHGHANRVGSVAFSRDGRSIVSASEDQTLRIWDVSGTPEPTVLHVADAPVFSAAFSPDGHRLVTASVDRTVQVWNANGQRDPLVLRGHDGVVYSAAFSPDGRRIASSSADNTVRVWDADGRGEPLVLRGHDDLVWTAAFSPDGRRIVSTSKDKTIRVWSADGRGEPLVLRGHTEAVRSAAFSPDGQSIVSCGFDATVRVWRADGSGEPVVLLGHTAGVQSAAFSPDGRRIVSAAFDKTIRVWNADGRGEPVILRGHGDRVMWAAFSPDGRRIVSSSADRTIRIWRADGQGDPVVLLGHDLPVERVGFSPDGRSIVSASQDGTVRVWHDLAPVSLEDPRLWTMSSYCMPVERRIKLLGMTEEQAGRGRESCLARVARATGSSSPR